LQFAAGVYPAAAASSFVANQTLFFSAIRAAPEHHGRWYLLPFFDPTYVFAPACASSALFCAAFSDVSDTVSFSTRDIIFFSSASASGADGCIVSFPRDSTAAPCPSVADADAKEYADGAGAPD